MLAEDKGVAPDLTGAFFWLSLAAQRASGGDENLARRARDARDAVAQRLSPEKLAAGRKGVENWIPKGGA